VAKHPAEDSSAPDGFRQTRVPLPRHASLALLAIDDEAEILELIRRWLAELPLHVHTATTAASGFELAKTFRPGMVLLDVKLPDQDGLKLLPQLLANDPGCEVVLMTGYSSVESAVEAMRLGAADYLPKPIAMTRLLEIVRSWHKRASVYLRTVQLDQVASQKAVFEGIVGRSPAMLDLFDKLQRIAPHFTNVLITGETGTGKDLVASVLHKLSPRRDRPFVVCNCAAIAETLFESELFGHTKGAFTGAYMARPGLIETASGGTLFLDEVGEIPLAVQAKFLRFLQSREVQRVGDPTVRVVDVNIIAATNRNLEELSGQGRFRSDLYYRLSTVTVGIPRLSQRMEDLGPLIQHFLTLCSRLYGKPQLDLTRRARALLRSYPWPGNVRELQNAIHYAAMMCRADLIDIEDLPETIALHPKSRTEHGGSKVLTLAEAELAHVIEVLELAGGNRSKAADILGISRSTLYRILEKAGLDPARGHGEHGEEIAQTGT